MYPKNNASPPIIAVGQVILIADGSVVTADASARVKIGTGGWGASAGTLACDSTSGCWTYVPSQAETNAESFIVAVYKASCIGCQATVITTASAVAGNVQLAAAQPAVTFASVTSTGALTVSDGIIVTASTGNRPAVSATGNGTGAAFLLTGGATGPGVSVVTAGAAGIKVAATGIGLDIDATTAGIDIDSASYAVSLTSTANDALHIVTTSETKHGVEITGGGTGHGVCIVGGAEGNGVDVTGGATSGSGVAVRAGTGSNADGFTAVGDGTGNGMSLLGGATGHGVHTIGGATSGHGIWAHGQTIGHGLYAYGGATSGDGINAAGQTLGDGMTLVGAGEAQYDLNADIHGTLDTVTNLTNATGGQDQSTAQVMLDAPAGVVFVATTATGGDEGNGGTSWDDAKLLPRVAVNALTAGQACLIGPGTFAMGANKVVQPAGTIVEGAGIDATILTSTISSALAWVPGTGCKLRNLTLSLGTDGNRGFGMYYLVDSAFTGVELENVKIIGKDDAIFISADAGVCKMVIRDCIFETDYDGITASGGVGTIIDVQNTSVTCVSTEHSCKAVNVTAGIVRLFDCTLSATTTAENESGDGVYVAASGEVIMSGGSAYGLGDGSGTSYDLRQAETGILRVDGVQYDSTKTSGTIKTAKKAATIAVGDIANNAITNAAVADDVDVNVKTITAGAIAAATFTAGAINAAAIAADAIEAAKIKDGAITNAKVADDVDVNVKTISANAITATAINADAITSAKIADNAIAAEHLADNAIDLATFAADCKTGSALKANVETITAGAITAAAIATGAIDADAIADNAIDAGAIATGAITNAKFAAGAIDAAAIAANAIDAATFAADVDAEIAAMVWNAATASYGADAGSYGYALEAAGSAADPWLTELPGLYASGTAGYIIGGFSASSDPWGVELPGSYTGTEAGKVLSDLLAGVNVTEWLGTEPAALTDTDKVQVSLQHVKTALLPSASDIANAAAAATVTALDTGSGLTALATAANLTALAGKFTGITLLANWLRGLARKDTMDSTAKTELNSGGGTFDEATDSEEALSEAVAGVSAGSGLNAQETRDAMALAPSVGVEPADGSIDDMISDIEAGSGLNAQETRDAMALAPSVEVEVAEGSIDDLISDIATSSGEGAYTGTLTVDDGSGNALEGVVVNARRGGVLIASGLTDVNGQITDWVFDASTYDLSARLTGYHSETDTITVTGDAWSKTISMSILTVTTDATLCTVQFSVTLSGAAVSGAVCKARLLGINQAADGSILSNEAVYATTTSEGLAELQLVRASSIIKGSGLYRITATIAGKPIASVDTTIPNQASVSFEDLLA